MSIADGQPVNAASSNAAFVSRSSTQTVGGVKTFTDTTESTDKDSGSIILEGGLGVEKKINAGGDISTQGDVNAVGNVNAANINGSNTGDVTLAPVGNTPANEGASLVGQVLTLQPADATHAGLISTSAQQIAGDKTFNDNVVIQGDLQVNGTTTTVNTTNLEVTDQNILVNNGGNDASAEGAGLDVERASDNGALRFDSTLLSKWKLGLASAMSEVITAAFDQTITGLKTFTGLTKFLAVEPTSDLSGDNGSLTKRWNHVWGDFISATSSMSMRDSSSQPLIGFSANQSTHPTLGSLVGYFCRGAVDHVVNPAFGFIGRAINNAAQTTQHLFIRSGNNNAAGGTSGDVIIESGSATNRGKIFVKDGSEGLGKVLTSDANGRANWQTPSGGGSALTVQDEGSNLSTAVTNINFAGAGVVATQPVANEILVTIGGGGGGGVPFSQHFNSSTFILKTVSSIDTFEDVATMTMADTFNNADEVIFKLCTTVGCYNPSGGVSRGVIGIFDYNNNPIALAYFGDNLLSGQSNNWPVFIEKRYTFTETVGSPIFKIKMKNIDTNNQTQCGFKNWTGSGTGDEATNEFWSYRNN